MRAKSENKAIFLWIGYSTCHWCHVVERESFSSPEIDASSRQFFSERLPMVREFLGYPSRAATAYVCQNFAWQLPTIDRRVLPKLLTVSLPGQDTPSR